MLFENIGMTGCVNRVENVVVTGFVPWTTDPTSISFTVVLDVAEYYAYDINGNLVYGLLAMQNAIANALMDSRVQNVFVYDPIVDVPNPPPTIPINQSMLQITIGALTTSNSTALAAVTVTNVPMTN